jgi:Rod binding domain-containing protein
MDPIDRAVPRHPIAAPQASSDAALREVAKKLETAFLNEMLKSSGFGEARKAFGGGMGEDQFASFLRAEHASAMVERGGLGLAESLFNALKERQHADE